METLNTEQPERLRLTVAARREEARKLADAGKSQREIASQLGVNASTINRDLADGNRDLSDGAASRNGSATCTTDSEPAATVVLNALSPLATFPPPVLAAFAPSALTPKPKPTPQPTTPKPTTSKPRNRAEMRIKALASRCRVAERERDDALDECADALAQRDQVVILNEQLIAQLLALKGIAT
jgi:Helix-turn-helix domain